MKGFTSFLFFYEFVGFYGASDREVLQDLFSFNLIGKISNGDLDIFFTLLGPRACHLLVIHMPLLYIKYESTGKKSFIKPLNSLINPQSSSTFDSH